MTPTQIFESKVVPNLQVTESGCMEWSKCRSSAGYGQLRVNGKLLYTHRVSFEAHNSKLQEGEVVRHTCDNPSCCNPLHLGRGTHRDNMQDCVKRGRYRTPHLQGSAHGQAVLTEQDVISIFESKLKGVELARMFGVTPSAISSINRRKTWHHVTSTLINT